MKLSLRKSVITTISAIALTIGIADNAKANLVMNGDFSVATTNKALVPKGLDPESWIYGATSSGIAYVYGSGAADKIGGVSGGFGRPLYLWGPENPGANSINGLTASSPDGGNYLASDSDFPFSGTFSQTITGLTPGNAYMLNFWYAAAQLRHPDGTLWNGETYSRWDVDLGTAGSFSTPTLTIGNHGFSGWMSATHIFTVPTTSTGSEVLQFLAVGGPGGLPPVALLDGVSLFEVPEPETYTLMIFSLLGVLAAKKRRRTRI